MGTLRGESLSARERLLVSDILLTSHRNHVLRILQHQGTPMTLDSLANTSGCPIPNLLESDLTVSATTEAKTQLHHVHLPKLDDAGLITYDSDEQVVVSLDEERLDFLLELGLQLFRSLKRGRA